MRDFKIRGYTVAQSPNPPVIIAVAAAVLSRIFGEGTTAYAACRAVFFVALTIWSYGEIAEGVNGFRRILGALGLAYVLYSITRELD